MAGPQLKGLGLGLGLKKWTTSRAGAHMRWPAVPCTACNVQGRLWNRLGQGRQVGCMGLEKKKNKCTARCVGEGTPSGRGVWLNERTGQKTKQGTRTRGGAERNTLGEASVCCCAQFKC